MAITYNEHGRKAMPGLVKMLEAWKVDPKNSDKALGIQSIINMIYSVKLLENEYIAANQSLIEKTKLLAEANLEIAKNGELMDELYRLIENESPDMAAFVKGQVGQALINIKNKQS